MVDIPWKFQMMKTSAISQYRDQCGIVAAKHWISTIWPTYSFIIDDFVYWTLRFAAITKDITIEKTHYKM